ncbi:valine--tRNA ligase [Vulcanimicrobium alpinum]|uniref:Valine--tRNA ligase n=1 Tax=Vulcanimicrobium alpinum TaxID=3016050 RepID=A0AAN1XXT2_UNVUL|nr:valine--tRNA ligase [Vulcanimicrobium alpinum]BDE06576.1 valine--tRNA ligase [Vulcanimicrobium alpinum]
MNQGRPELPKQYDPAEVEPRLYARALGLGVFHEAPDPARPPFVISMPPPNITGRAHLGHGSTYTPMDVLTRYHRMLGENADWIPGQDHAAIATEAVLVRELAKEGKTREGLGRDAFLARAWEWREQYGDAINEAFRRLGFGPDWERQRFTMDAGLSAAVIKVFVDLYNDGLIYRGTRLVNWDPTAGGTLSDAEVENDDVDTFLWHVRYRAEDGGDGLVIATTRPETYLADVAVAVHPDDERYRDLIGKNVVLPIVNRPIPVIADDAVESSFGTGAVKVTPAHDQTDYEIGTRHGLAMPTVIDYDGRIVAPVWRYDEAAERRAPIDAQGPAMQPYVGLDRFDARARIVADLRASGALVQEAPYHTTVPVSSRSHAVIEPLLSLQWFVRMESLAAPALEAYRSGALRFVPERFGRTYAAGLETLRDWNISRQVWWGHQLPVWYTPADDVVVAHDEGEARAIARERFGTADVRRDPDTLDTWFSSGLWPFSILGWPERTPELDHWYPNQVMITSRDIIFLWVSRMVMLGLRFVGRLPFETVFVTPLVFDMQGRKMSKSLGNAIDPMTDLVPNYGADGTRFGILRQMRLESQELRFDERYCDEAKRFATKLWNALRYTCSLDEGLPRAAVLPPHETLTLADRWILTELRRCVENVTAAFDRFAFGVAADTLLQFGWYTFCDWYLEATKAPSQRETRAAVLSFALNAFVRALHPIAPFVSEEIWLTLPHDGTTIVTASWPDVEEIPAFPDDAATFAAVMAKIDELRNVRAEWHVAPKDRLRVEIPASLAGERDVVEAIETIVRAEIATYPGGNGAIRDWVFAVRAVADSAKLRERYARELARLDGEVARSEKKLANDAFVAKASPDVVAAERAKLDEYRRERERAQRGLDELA